MPKTSRPAPRLVIEELSPERWPDLERLFGHNGACGGCWCMYWRIEKGERYEDVKGPEAKRRLRVLVRQRRAHGLIAYKAGEPVGWCSFERRVDLPRLDRAPSLRVADAESVWSLPCFFIKAGHRNQGVAVALLRGAVRVLSARGARILEGYPTKPSTEGKMPGAWAWTGVPSMFEAAGFTRADERTSGKQRYRKRIRSRP